MKKKTSISLEINLAGRMTLSQPYEFLCTLWERDDDFHQTLIDLNVANKNGILPRGEISLYTARDAVAFLSNIDLIANAYEIGYARLKDDAEKS